MQDCKHRARAAFYRLGGPWLRRGVFEAVGSKRYSYPASHGIDRRLLGLFPDEGGTFVEAGAHDGYTFSNTYYLERFRGWSGLLVEAVPELSTKARQRRRRSVVFNAALVPPELDGESVPIHFGDLMSTLGDPEYAQRGLDNARLRGYTVSVAGRTLSSLLDEVGMGAPDLLVLDVEGNEMGALRGLDLSRHAPRFMVIEMVDLETLRPQFDALLADSYDFKEMISPHDALYERRAGE